jgi:epoxyqueuosine reductase
MQSLEEKSLWIKQQSLDYGFNFCGISKATFLEKEAKDLENWLAKNYHGQMDYMANHFDKRLNLRLLVPGAKSVISLMLNYFPKEDLALENKPKISKYAYGEDYHTVIKEKLFGLIGDIKKQYGDLDARVFLDSAPVMDKVWAKKAGLGWVGKHTNLIINLKAVFSFWLRLFVT